MSIQFINTGTSANAGNGDSIRAAFTKVNDNFDFLNGLIVGTSTTFVSSIHNIVKPMFIHDLHQRVNVTYNNINDQIVLNFDPFTNTDLTIKSLDVLNTASLNDVSITGTVTIGDEKNYVRILENAGVYLKNESIETTIFNFTDGNEFSNSSCLWFEEDGANYIEYTSTDPILETVAFNFSFGSLDNTVEITDGLNSHILSPTGYFANLGNNVFRIGISGEFLPPGFSISITAMTFTFNTPQVNEASFSNNDFTIEVTNDISLTGGNIVAIRNNSPTESIQIITNYDNLEKIWAFGSDGNLTFPDDSTQQTAWAGGRVVNAPSTSKGAVGDKIGDLAFNSAYIYYCIANYTDGIANIWKRIQWSVDTW